MTEHTPDTGGVSDDPSDGPTAEWFAELAADDPEHDPFARPADPAPPEPPAADAPGEPTGADEHPPVVPPVITGSDAPSEAAPHGTPAEPDSGPGTEPQPPIDGEPFATPDAPAPHDGPATEPQPPIAGQPHGVPPEPDNGPGTGPQPPVAEEPFAAPGEPVPHGGPAYGVPPEPDNGPGTGPQPPVAEEPFAAPGEPVPHGGPAYGVPAEPDNGPGTGPLPPVGEEHFAGPGTGPQPVVPAEGEGTGPQPAVGEEQPGSDVTGTGPQPTVEVHPDLAALVALGRPDAQDENGTPPAGTPVPGVDEEPEVREDGSFAGAPVAHHSHDAEGERAPGVVVESMPVDSVAVAERTPDQRQPYVELGMNDEEYRRVRQILGRRPTSAELAIYSVMWSEHCSYKSSKVHLRQFGEKAPKTDALLVGMGENAGVVDVGRGLAVTFKVESHNHPSYVEPYQGAATGVGGIVRDILSMGARPIAVMDSLRFGPAEAPDTQRVLPGVVAGISGYGNSLGLPNIGGETVFDPCYEKNPLVNALCIGVMRHEDIKRATAPGPGNKVILFGATTGPDGIGGASVLASATFDEESQAKRPSVQVGDPFMEKLLIECCMELYREDLVVGIQDLGAAGVSCATTELAAAGTGGMHVVLDAVPLRDETLRPEEILMSESQERMMAVVEPAKVDRFLEICAKWEIPATVIGEVTDTGRLVMTWRGEVIVDIPPGTAADEGPVYERPYEPPADLAALQADTPGRLARPANADDLRNTVLWLAASPNLSSKTWVTSQYDRYVLGNTVLAMPEDAGVLRLDDETGLGVALSLDGNGRYTRLDPYSGAQLALSEAYRNVAATGARPLAVTNCLNFGSPEDPGVMWQFAQATKGLADACQALGVPVTGGNVSFYNQTDDKPINPTPVVGVLGVHDDVRRRVSMAFPAEGHMLVLLGETREEFGGSEWAHVVYGHLGGLPPLVDLPAERALAAVLVTAAHEGLLSGAHDLSDGGLSQALVESCLRGGLGVRVTLPGDPFVALFSESVARAVVAVRPGSEARLGQLCEAAGVPATQLGVVGGDSFTVEGLFSIPLHELREAHERLLPSYA